MQSTSEAAKNKSGQVQPAQKPLEPLPNPFLPKPAQLPANPYESAEQSRLQDVPKLELPKVKPAEEKPAEPLKVAQLKDKPGEAKISRAQRIHEQSEILRAVMEGEAPTGEYHREKPENRPRGEEKPPEMYDRMSRLGSIGGRRPDVEEQKKKENKPKEGGEETTL